MENRLKEYDYLLLALLPFIASLIALTFRTNYLITTLLFFGIGPLWFTFRVKPIKICKAALFTILLAGPLGTVVLDYILVSDQAWWSPTIFPWRLMGILPFEDLIWGILQGYFVIILYEHFFDKGRDTLVGPNIKYFAWFLATLLTIFFSAYLFQPELLKISYAYLWIGLIFFIIPSSMFLIHYPQTILKIIKLSVYFLILHICFELTALELGNWIFTGAHYVAVMPIGGRFLIPIEEIIIWWLLFIVSIISWYEFFDDDCK